MTGLGAVTGLGVGVDHLWRGLCEGHSAIGPIEAFDPSGFRCRLASEVKGFRARDFVPKSYRKAVKVMARDIELAVGAAKLAVEDAGIETKGTLNGEGEPTFASHRIGCQIGAGFIACDAPELAQAEASSREEDGAFSMRRWGEEGMGNLSPLWMLKYLPNMLACHVTIIHDAKGPSNTITCCEASGLLSIGESRRVIERDDSDVCFSGGAESKLNPLGFLRMHYAERLAETGDEGEASRIVRPFDEDSAGSLIGEGAGIVLIESAAAARERTRAWMRAARSRAHPRAGRRLRRRPVHRRRRARDWARDGRRERAGRRGDGRERDRPDRPARLGRPRVRSRGGGRARACLRDAS